MSFARVTVVIPVYNDEWHLAEALESVLAQTYGDWEAIIVDDASSDGSRAVAAAFAERDPRVRVIGLDHNVGVPNARNLAVAASSGGDLVALLDSDDRWREDYLECTVALYDATLAEGRRAGIIACDALIHGRDGVTGEKWSELFWWRDVIDYESMIERNYVLARALFSRQAYDEVGGFSPRCVVRDTRRGRYAASDDYDLWMRMIEQGYEVVTTPEPLAVYRWDPAGRSHAPGLVAEAALVAYRRALTRGTLTPPQRRALKSRIRHEQALHARGGVYDAIAEHRRLTALALGIRAAPRGLVAFLQAPSRWGEWLRGLGRRDSRTSKSARSAAR